MPFAKNLSMDELEQLDQKRNRALAWFLGVFLFWSITSVLMIGAFIVLMKAGINTDLPPLILVPSIVIPLLVSMVLLARYAFIQGKIRANPELARMMDEEMVREAWRRSAATGFWVMLAVEVLATIHVYISGFLMGAGILQPSPILLDSIQAPLSITVGVGVTIGRYLYLRRG